MEMKRLFTYKIIAYKVFNSKGLVITLRHVCLLKIVEYTNSYLLSTEGKVFTIYQTTASMVRYIMLTVGHGMTMAYCVFYYIHKILPLLIVL